MVAGVAVAAHDSGGAWWSQIVWWRVALALVVALSLQIGVNYANDYSDGIRGTDAERVGPIRLTASGLVPPRRVRTAAFLMFAIAGIAGVILAISAAWWFVLVGAASILAAWFYTGGSSPYGYLGFGDVAVFVFFGLVAVIGTAYVSAAHPHWIWLALWVAIPMGLLADAVLVANNLRDLPKDKLVGKLTSAVRLGDHGTRWMYVACVVVPVIAGFVLAIGIPAHPVAMAIGVVLMGAVAARAFPPVRRVLRGANGRELIPVLVVTGTLQLTYAVAFAIFNLIDATL